MNVRRTEIDIFEVDIPDLIFNPLNSDFITETSFAKDKKLLTFKSDFEINKPITMMRGKSPRSDVEMTKK